MNLRKTRQLINKLIYLLVLLTLTSCGQKGDLYLPDKAQAAVDTHPVTS